jgi:hypothetical protein
VTTCVDGRVIGFVIAASTSKSYVVPRLDHVGFLVDKSGTVGSFVSEFFVFLADSFSN